MSFRPLDLTEVGFPRKIARLLHEARYNFRRGQSPFGEESYYSSYVHPSRMLADFVDELSFLAMKLPFLAMKLPFP